MFKKILILLMLLALPYKLCFASDYVICTESNWDNDVNQGNYDGYFTTIALWETARDGVDTATENSTAYIYGTFTQTSEIRLEGWTPKDAGYYIIITKSIEG
ncbi:unnamed protein product, partial [marine sediment metagenome]